MESEMNPVPNPGPFMGLLTSPNEEEALDRVDEFLNAYELPSTQNPKFNITVLAPEHGYCNKETKVLIVGDFHEHSGQLDQSDVYCCIGGTCVKAQSLKPGVFCILVPQNTPGPADLYITLDCQTPTSQILTFTYLPDNHNGIQNPNPEPQLRDIQLQTRLAQLVFSFNKIGVSPPENTNSLLEVVLRNRIEEWAMEKKSEGCVAMPLDEEGQGVIHLSAMLGYVWAANLFAKAGCSLNFRDSTGRTPLHWAADCGRIKMVVALLLAGADPCLATHDPYSGSTAADLAAKRGFCGLAAYLAENSLMAHFKALSDDGNLDSHTSSKSASISKRASHLSNVNEEELFQNACNTALDVATKIQTALRKIDSKRKRTETVTGDVEDDSDRKGREVDEAKITRWVEFVEALKMSQKAQREYKDILDLDP